ncbi:MAG TPA: hypothetical protein ENF73_02115 [Proteobacteria bacterium]|nr:hypothetical protein [Pseudomonadota bacterium]
MLKRLRDILLRNWSFKLLSVAFAFVLWIFVTTKTPSEEVPVEVKIVYKNWPEDLVTLDDPPQSLLVRVAGPKLVLKSLAKRVLYYEIDLKGTRRGRSMFSIIPSKINGLPPGLEVTSINPSYFNLTFDKKVKRVLPVKLITISEPKEGYRIKRIRVSPKMVEVVGPESVLKGMKEIPTEAVDIADASFPIEREVMLDQTIKHLQFPSGDTVNVSIDIEPVWVSRVFKNVPITVINTSLDHRVEPSVLTIKLTMIESGIKSLKPEDIKLLVDAKGLPAGEHLVVPVLKLPEEMLLQKQPKLPEVKVRLWESGKPASRKPSE